MAIPDDDQLSRIAYIDALRAAQQGEDVEAWLVGGVVRDLLLGRLPADIDIATPRPEPLARRFADLVNGKVVPMDPERGIWRVALRGDITFDFCGYRDTDVLGDLQGRDFTINALALRLPQGELFDPSAGARDLQEKSLRMVSPRAFRDDPARVLRAFRFVSELGMTIEEDTWTALREEAYRLPSIAPERLLAEWWKLCGGAHAARAIQLMDEAGVLGILSPELEATKGVVQNAYHHLDVWGHSLLATTFMVRLIWHPGEFLHDLQAEFAPLLEDAHRRARLVLLALIHDIGKPATRTVKEGKTHFYGHEQVGAGMAVQMAQRWRMSREDQRALDVVIHRHLRPLHMIHARKRGELSAKTMSHFLDDAGEYVLEVLALALADKSAGQGPLAEANVQEQLRELYRELLAFRRQRYLPTRENPLLTGIDLMQLLHMSPGPAMGALLHRIRDGQMQGRFATRDEALAWASEHLPKKKG